jgi:hypothetical protein
MGCSFHFRFSARYTKTKMAISQSTKKRSWLILQVSRALRGSKNISSPLSALRFSNRPWGNLRAQGVQKSSEDMIMTMIGHMGAISNKALWTGRVLSGLVVLFLIFDFGIKLVPLDVVIQSLAELGYPATMGMARGLGVLLMICTVLYVIPQTSILGAILLTGYLGGAIATHLRIGSPIFSHLLFGVYLGLLIWGGLYLRDPRVRALIPFAR